MKYKSINKRKIDLMVFIQEIIYLKLWCNICNKFQLVYIDRNTLDNFVRTCFYSSGVELIIGKFKKFLGSKDAEWNIYGIQANDLIIYRYFWIRFIDFMLKVRANKYGKKVIK